MEEAIKTNYIFRGEKWKGLKMLNILMAKDTISLAITKEKSLLYQQQKQKDKKGTYPELFIILLQDTIWCMPLGLHKLIKIMREYNYLSLSTIKQYIPEAKKLGVSKIARSQSGFLTAYKRAKGNSNNLSERWRIKRHGFIKRHLAQYRVNPTYRRKLALIIWAYMPWKEKPMKIGESIQYKGRKITRLGASWYKVQNKVTKFSTLTSAKKSIDRKSKPKRKKKWFPINLGTKKKLSGVKPLE